MDFPYITFIGYISILTQTRKAELLVGAVAGGKQREAGIER